MARTKERPKVTSGSRRMNSFFTGIGGFDLAFAKHGFAPAFHCEKNGFCRSVLKRHWPEVANADDIEQLAAQDIPVADLWTAGFPCQDLSLARTPHGKRSGLKGSQSGLFYTFLALLSAHRPPIVLLENVAGLLNSHNGNDFNALIASLTQLGYAVAWRALNARYFGTPQSRPRIFICAWYGAPAKAVRALFEEELAAKPKDERRGFMVESKCSTSGISVPQVSFCISATSGRHTGLDWARSYVIYPNAVRRLTPLECERLQGLPDNWTMPDKDYVVPIRGIDTNRYHAIGNAVCVPVAQWVAGRIANTLQTPPPTARSSKKPAFPKELHDLANTFLSIGAEVRELRVDAEGSKWKSGGIAYNGWFVTANVSPSPTAEATSRLIDVIEKSAVHNRYFLSANAAQGILRRVDKMGRRLFPPLDAVLRQMVIRDPASDDDAEESTRDRELVAP